MKQPTKIVLTGGGSGGHITPLLSLAHELKELAPDCEITYIGHKGDQFDSLRQRSSDFDFVSFVDGGKFRRYHGESLLSHLTDIRTLALNARDFFKVITSIIAAFRILRRVKPDIVFSKGGFVVVPVGLAAKALRVPIVTHDSDAVPGLANRIVGRWAIVNATGMPAKYYNYPSERVEYVGVPMSSPDIKPVRVGDLPSLKKMVQLPERALVLMITGGGNGSQKLNELMVAVAPRLMRVNPALHIVHLSGQQHEESLAAAYRDVLDNNELKRLHVMGFTPYFYRYAAAADLILSRAGATAISEFAALGKACVIMPSPFLAGGHQLKNAEELAAQDAAVVIKEETTADELLAVMLELLKDTKRRLELSNHIRRLAKPDAAENLARIILKAAQKDHR